MRSISEINQKIKEGKALVVTKDELLSLIEEKGYKNTFKEVDVVTTATFGPMCSSGIYFNVGHSQPKIKLGGGKVTLEGVPCYTGLSAVDLFLGAAALPEDDPRNRVYPGNFGFGGGHVIEKLVRGDDLLLLASAYGTDCYPRKELKTLINIKDLNEVVLFNIRNCYQNYNVAVNLSDKPIYTYMGVLKPNLGNANFCSAGYYSPLLCDPHYKTIGIGTKIFLGGGVGFVAFWGTQHNPCVERTEKGVPKRPAGTLALIGDLKGMNSQYLRGTSMIGYGVTLSVGVGVPIPILDEEIFENVCVKDEEIFAPVVDYSYDYPQGTGKILGEVSYKQLRSGVIQVQDEEVNCGCLSSLRKAKDIAGILKDWISQGRFFLTEKVENLPGCESGYRFKPLKERLK
ncbi:MAG TPA: hypothetical protein ENI31_06880 [Candidatus Omnitrophica bacterium]|nr:MAG: hypothetical protein DRP61_02250 [Candidatus Omnitrophota bacterium]RKY35735.1 MAG: hypothetical protein DRP69_00545 [Candidatus Omnitrophota bacterium]RKY44574.1 MAG: hypothetical protein DRP80_01880 [Candidatus Omnitrophota bacterium]HEC69987.1 hypothetical protein [Candidatus Omnitrophota bacterium]